MFTLPLLLLVPSAPLPPDRHVPPVVDLEAFPPPAELAPHHGRLVRASILARAGATYYPEYGFTVAGYEGAGGVILIYLAGERDVRDGDRVEAVGVLRVIRHPADGEQPAWVEVRVDEG